MRGRGVGTGGQREEGVGGGGRRRVKDGRKEGGKEEKV